MEELKYEIGFHGYNEYYKFTLKDGTLESLKMGIVMLWFDSECNAYEFFDTFLPDFDYDDYDLYSLVMDCNYEIIELFYKEVFEALFENDIEIIGDMYKVKYKPNRYDYQNSLYSSKGYFSFFCKKTTKVTDKFWL